MNVCSYRSRAKLRPILALALSTALPQSSAAAALRAISKIEAPLSGLPVGVAASAMPTMPPALAPSLKTGLSPTLSSGFSLQTPRLPPALSAGPAPRALEAPLAAAASPLMKAPAAAGESAGSFGFQKPGDGGSNALDRLKTAALGKITEKTALPTSLGLESFHRNASKVFDGSGYFDGTPVPAARPRAAGRWRPGRFQSPRGGTIRYQRREARDAQGRAPTVYVGGLAFAESFDSYFRTQAAPRADQYFAWLRGLPPTRWSPTESVFDADTLDLAALIVRAAQESGADRVNLALHSYSTLLVQHLLALWRDPVAARALKLLSNGRVTILMGSTHYDSSEYDLGWEYVMRTQMAGAVLAYIDAKDAEAQFWALAARVNPALLPAASAIAAAWNQARLTILSAAAKEIASELRGHFSEPWDESIEPIRRRLLRRIARASRLPSWQEAALRRLVDFNKLEFTPEDVATLRLLGIRVDIVASRDDQVIPWVVQQRLLTRLGIKAPETPPERGTVIEDESGLFRFRIVESDHYFPLKKPRELEKILNGPPPSASRR